MCAVLERGYFVAVVVDDTVAFTVAYIKRVAQETIRENGRRRRRSSYPVYETNRIIPSPTSVAQSQSNQNQSDQS